MKDFVEHPIPEQDTSRIIGMRTGSERGPLLIVLAQIHGNEPAGTLAMEEVFHKIDEERHLKPHFDFRGRIVGIKGNIPAAEIGERFIHTDMNRLWTQENVARIRATDHEHLHINEEHQLKEVLQAVEAEIAAYAATKVILLDLHTTTAHGGIFIIPSKEEKSRQLGLHIQAPVLHGFLDNIQGTTLHYFSSQNYPNIDITTLCFEAGQHESADAVHHAVSAIISCFGAAGGFYKDDIETKHEELLSRDSKTLPREAQLIYSHSVHPEDGFKMREDKIYRNFDRIRKGELLAFDLHGEIHALCKGRILMPLYQKQGSDGFFVIQDINPDAAKLYKKIPTTTLNA